MMRRRYGLLVTVFTAAIVAGTSMSLFVTLNGDLSSDGQNSLGRRILSVYQVLAVEQATPSGSKALILAADAAQVDEPDPLSDFEVDFIFTYLLILLCLFGVVTGVWRTIRVAKRDRS